MAKYSDYVQKQDDIQSEIEEAQVQTAERNDIPDSVRKRFDGKSLDDVLASYANLEAEKSRLGDNLGKVRKQADQLIEMQLAAPTAPHREDTTESVDPLTVDDLYDDTEGAIARVVEKQTNKRVEALEAQLAKQAQNHAKATLNDKFDAWEEEIRSEEFIQWVGESGFRTRLAQQADTYDLDAANDLLSEWYSKKNIEEERAQSETRSRQLDDATLETSSPGGIESEVTYSRTDIMQKRIAANRGSQEAQLWLRNHGDAIRLAYEEERVTD
jgi:hypothetical protein